MKKSGSSVKEILDYVFWPVRAILAGLLLMVAIGFLGLILTPHGFREMVRILFFRLSGPNDKSDNFTALEKGAL